MKGMMMNKKDYRYVVTYTEGEGWWFMDPTGVFWEGSNIWDHEKGEFLMEHEITEETQVEEWKAAESLSNAIDSLNDQDYYKNSKVGYL
jgi:hypothetical protein